MISDGRLFALGTGLLTVFKSPVTLDVALMCVFCGSETVRREGIRRLRSLGE
jgi:hypothetical protein